MWLRLAPLVVLYVIEAFAIGPMLQKVWISTFPFLAEHPHPCFPEVTNSPKKPSDRLTWIRRNVDFSGVCGVQRISGVVECSGRNLARYQNLEQRPETL